MTDVLILEDELTSLQALSEILTTYSDDIRVHKASSLKEAKDLLDQEIRYGLFLLDVNLSGEDREDIGGILFAREIRERFEYTFTPIVMVTAIGNMEMQAYRELHCYQYIMKPFHREQVEEVVQKVLEKESREKPPVIVVKKDGINYQLKCEDIRYLEAIPRGTRLHLVTENWDVPYVTLRQMLLKMPKGMFAQCHRMYAVNKNEVEYYDTVNRIIRIKNCPDTVEIGVTYKSVIGGLLNGWLGTEISISYFLRNGTYGISLSDCGFSDQRYLRLPGVYHVCSDGDRCNLGNCGLAK